MAHETQEFIDTLGEGEDRLVLKWVEETPFTAAHWHFNGYDGHMHFADQPIANIIHHLMLDGYVPATVAHA